MVNWSAQDVTEDMFTSQFLSGQYAGLVLYADTKVEAAEEPVTVCFVFQDENGNLIRISVSQVIWAELWNGNGCAIDLPWMPEEPGQYLVSLYWNGQLVGKWAFSLT